MRVGTTDQTNTQGLKITEANVLPFYYMKKWIDILVFSDKGEKLKGNVAPGVMVWPVY